MPPAEDRPPGRRPSQLLQAKALGPIPAATNRDSADSYHHHHPPRMQGGKPPATLRPNARCRDRRRVQRPACTPPPTTDTTSAAHHRPSGRGLSHPSSGQFIIIRIRTTLCLLALVGGCRALENPCYPPAKRSLTGGVGECSGQLAHHQPTPVPAQATSQLSGIQAITEPTHSSLSLSLSLGWVWEGAGRKPVLPTANGCCGQSVQRPACTLDRPTKTLQATLTVVETE